MIDRITGFIGAGKMAEAIIKGIVSSGIIPSSHLVFFDPSAQRRQLIHSSFGIVSAEDNSAVCRNASVLFLAVKPQHMDSVLEELRPVITEDHLLISIAAGVTIRHIKDVLQKNVRVIRTMPNTPCLLGYGMTALAPEPGVLPEDVELAQAIFDSVGRTLITSEDKLNTITALSGSGPAFIYEIAESFAQAGKSNGLTYEEALLLITQTMLGAAKMIESSNSTTKELIDMVSSPGGTTVAGLAVLQNGILRDVIAGTVAAAIKRAEELNKG